MVDQNKVNAFLAELRPRVSGDVRADQYTRVLYSTDASIYQVMPLAVFLPATADDVHAAVELAAKHGIPLLPRAGGSSLAGQAVNEALVLDMTRHLDRIIEINREEKWARVQPGVVLDVLNAELAPLGLQFGPDPASSNRAAMGGIVANNSTGSHSIVYGMTADHVLETKVLLSDGSEAHFRALDAALLEQMCKRSGREGDVYRRLATLVRANAGTIRAKTPRHWRRCGGYNLDRFVDGPTFNYPQRPGFNLAKLICGSEGTLAIMQEIKLNLVSRPRKTALAIVQFSNLHEALGATPAILETGPSAVELLDHLGLTLCRGVPAYARLLKTFLAGEPNCILVTEYCGESAGELRAKLQQLEAHLHSQKILATVAPAEDSETQQNVWTVRKAGLGLMMSIKGDHKPIPFIEDAAVPVEHLADYVTQIEKFCNDLGTKVAYYAHASAGCVHIRPLINTKMASDLEKLPQISRFSVELLGQYGGALSSEHGDGRARSWLNKHFFGEALYGLFEQVKQCFDPENLLNPGIIVAPQDMRENLRYGPGYAAIRLAPSLDFRTDMGFDRAVEMCNGAGICRKTTAGTMCPSFMATREEMHSTRGRANALRAALSGRLAPEELTGRRMYQVMDLCIECKACKAECPSSVDMAKIKFEFLAQYYRRHPASLRTKLFAGVAGLGRLMTGRRARLANLLTGNRLARRVVSAALGLAPQRTFPRYAPASFQTWFARSRRNPPVPQTGRQVVLFGDTFNTFHEPGHLIAAVELLEAAGHEVIYPGHVCCGRPAISKGFVETARRAAKATVEVLHPYAEAGIPIIGLEPSCLLSFRDEFLYLLPENEAARHVAEQSFLIEEFIAALAEKGELRLSFGDRAQDILLHGHCHQKSLVGTGPVAAMLRLPPKARVTEVDAGCCGMAGAFGYEKEHYAISMKMAERRLLPAVRAHDDGGLIAASGFSCRQQIAHGTGRTALHPVTILRRALERG